MDDELKQYLDAKFKDIDAKFMDMHEELERTETRLLSEFWKWGRSADQRIKRMEHSDATTVDRLTNLEERIFALERRVLGSKE